MVLKVIISYAALTGGTQLTESHLANCHDLADTDHADFSSLTESDFMSVRRNTAQAILITASSLMAVS